MGYWKSKVLPKIKKVFENTSSTKKAAAAEVSKSFDESKEDINKEFEEKKADLQPKVLEIYEASSVEVKTLVKEPKVAGLKKHSAAVQKFLDELHKIEFPGSKPVVEASSQYGPHMVSEPVFFLFEKVSTFIVVEEKVEAPATEATTAGEETSGTEKEIVVEEEKKEEVVVVVAEKAVEIAEPAEAAPSEPAAKVEEAKAEAPKP